MTTAARPAKVRDKLTLRDSIDLLLALNAAIEANIDEIELNGGALPDWMAAMLDEINDSLAGRADAIAYVVDQLKGDEVAAKATKDRAARREKVWGNSIAGIKAYALRELERLGENRVQGSASVLRIQRNGSPSTDLTAPIETHQSILLAAVDVSGALARFVTVQRIATLDKKALGAAYEARREQLEADTELLALSDIPFDVAATFADPDADVYAKRCAKELERMRAAYIADNLASEFPGVRCERGHHLRID